MNVALPRLGLAALALGSAVALSACDQSTTEPHSFDDPQFQRVQSIRTTTLDAKAVGRLARQVDEFNSVLARAGREERLDYPWLFVLGGGTDPFARLRTGTRWLVRSPTYILDASDYTTDLPATEVESTLVAAYEIWDDVSQSFLTTRRLGDPGTNLDVLDGTYDAAGNCVLLEDVTSPNLDLGTGLISPAADIVVGGWAPETYFSQCLGFADIIGVTWTFFGPDTNGDQYLDQLYIEQFYNPAFTWVTSGSVFLQPASGVDLLTIAIHENGHAHGLDHFGGPVRLQPFTLKPNGRVYNPEAVMNPFYLFGENRFLYATDEAAMRTMYRGLR